MLCEGDEPADCVAVDVTDDIGEALPVALCVEVLDWLAPAPSDAVGVALTAAGDTVAPAAVAAPLTEAVAEAPPTGPPLVVAVTDALTAAASEGLGEGDAALLSVTVSVFVRCVPTRTLTKTA